MENKQKKTYIYIYIAIKYEKYLIKKIKFTEIEISFYNDNVDRKRKFEEQAHFLRFFYANYKMYFKQM